MFRTILMAYDGSPNANDALTLAIDLAQRYDAKRVAHITL